ncbi:MAG: 3'-5' exonuclease [Elusimicrobiota bacterium]|nr:3'-5' exonuclease [Elusimicrobiota bacterium]
MKYTSFVFLDIETTGFACKEHRIVEIGILKSINRRITEEYSQLINPKRDIPWSVVSVHGIENKHVIDAPEIKQVKKKIVELLGDSLIVTHSSNNFDLHFMRNELGKDIIFDDRHINFCKLSRRLDKDCSMHSLGAVAGRYNVIVENQHRALGDAKTMYSCFHRMVEKHNIVDIKQILNIINR